MLPGRGRRDTVWVPHHLLMVMRREPMAGHLPKQGGPLSVASQSTVCVPYRTPMPTQRGGRRLDQVPADT